MKTVKMQTAKMKKANNPKLLSNIGLFAPLAAVKLKFQNKLVRSKLSPNKLSADQLAMSKLAVSFAFLLLLAACGGDTGGTGDSTDNNNPPKVDPPRVDCSIVPIPLGCPGYIVPENTYLTAAIASTERDSAIFGEIWDYKYIVTEKKYGTIADLSTKTRFTTDYFNAANIFTEANNDEIDDNTKNNIIKITGQQEHSDGTILSLETNYYYNHIEGKQFTRFLPAINKSRILGLGAKLVTEADVPTSGGLIFNATNWRGDSGDDIYQRLKGLVEKAKDLTFKGFALVRFFNSTPNYYYEKDYYPGQFILTFNSTGFGKTYEDSEAAGYNFFSMKITLDQTVTENKADPTASDIIDGGDTVKSVAKPAVKTIEIKNFSFKSTSTSTNKTYSAKDSESVSWVHIKDSGYFAFNQTKSGDIDQIAGEIVLGRMVDNNGQFLHTTFASNEFCDSNKPDCERVTLTE